MYSKQTGTQWIKSTLFELQLKALLALAIASFVVSTESSGKAAENFDIAEFYKSGPEDGRVTEDEEEEQRNDNANGDVDPAGRLVKRTVQALVVPDPHHLKKLTKGKKLLTPLKAIKVLKPLKKITKLTLAVVPLGLGGFAVPLGLGGGVAKKLLLKKKIGKIALLPHVKGGGLLGKKSPIPKVAIVPLALGGGAAATTAAVAFGASRIPGLTGHVHGGGLPLPFRPPPILGLG